VVSETTPVVSETAPVVSETAPVVSETTPAVSETAVPAPKAITVFSVPQVVSGDSSYYMEPDEYWSKRNQIRSQSIKDILALIEGGAL